MKRAGAARLEYFALMRRHNRCLAPSCQCVRMTPPNWSTRNKNGTPVCLVSSPPLANEMLRACALLLAAVAAAADFRVKFEVEVPSGAKEFTVLVHEDWAPIGAARFRELVEAKFYDNTRCVVGVGVAP